MIKYEAYNQTTRVQFLVEQEAIVFATNNNMQIRTIEQVENPPIVTEPTKTDWFNFEQSIYNNTPLVLKALNSTGNGFAFLSKVLADGKTVYASQNALAFSISVLLPSMIVPYTQEEIDFINAKLQENNFTISI